MMIKFVSYVPTRRSRRTREALLAEYAQARGVAIEAPIADRRHHREAPEDRHRVRRHAPAASACRVRASGSIPTSSARSSSTQKRIVIDESLDPEEQPGQGRALSLHAGARGRPLAPASRAVRQGPGSDLASRRITPSRRVICRSSQAKERIELQADLYASCLLMPRKLVFAAWDERSPTASRAFFVRTCGRTTLRRDARADDDPRARQMRARSESTMRCSRASPSHLPSVSSSRRSPCASGSKSSGCCTAQVPLQTSLLVDGREPFF